MTIRSGTVAVSDRWHRFRGFRKFNGFREFLFSGFNRFEVHSGSGFDDSDQFDWHVPCSMPSVPGWRSHEEIIAWQLSSELKNHVYGLIDGDPRIQRDERFRDHLQGAVSSAPRLIAEGFGRYLSAR